MSEESSSRGYFAQDLLGMWERIIELGKRFRFSYLQGTPNPTLTNEYRAELITLWVQLYPKVYKRKEFKNLSVEFMECEKYFEDPSKLRHEKNSGLVLFKMELTLRKIIEKLGIT